MNEFKNKIIKYIMLINRELNNMPLQMLTKGNAPKILKY
jgi:hypothetical protein